MIKQKPPLKCFDFLVIIAALAITVFSAFTAYAKPRDARAVSIRGPAQKWIFPLDAEETVNIEGPLGTTVVRVHANSAWVESSPCANQTCAAAGHISSAGEWTACLPNGVLIIIEGKNESEDALDAGAW